MKPTKLAGKPCESSCTARIASQLHVKVGALRWPMLGEDARRSTWRLREKGKAAANLRLCPSNRCRTVYVLVVLVLVDAPADVVLAAIQLALFGLGQMAIVLRHIRLLLLLHAGFPLLQIGSFLRAQ